jgi:hypothetical protein
MANYTAVERQALAKQGKALPDGSFPIVDAADLSNAITAYGLGTNNSSATIKAFIIKRASELGLTKMLPAGWS